MIRLIRRIVGKVGLLTLASWAWQHRGSMVRAADMLRRAPQLLQDGRMDALTTEARAIVALDKDFASDTDVRITGIDEGGVVLRDTLAGPKLQKAHDALCSLRDVLDVRTEAAEHPTLDDALASGGR